MGVHSLYLFPKILKYTHAAVYSNAVLWCNKSGVLLPFLSPLIIAAGVFFHPLSVFFSIFRHTHSLFQTRDGFEAFQQPLKVLFHECKLITPLSFFL